MSDASFLKGEGGEVLFQNVIDKTTVIGPRPATDADKEAYAGEWARFQAENPPPPPKPAPAPPPKPAVAAAPPAPRPAPTAPPPPTAGETKAPE